MKTQCSICNAQIDSEESAVLTMGGFASPRHICSECESDIDTASLAKDTDAAEEAMSRISKKMADNNVEDKFVLQTVKDILIAATERAEKIKLGEYDFANDEDSSPETEDGVPEELRETEEDKELDRKEAEAGKRFDKISNWVCLVILAAALAFFIYRVISVYFL